jgi:hypothetical protein
MLVESCATIRRIVQRRKATASVHPRRDPVQDFAHYLSAVISGYQERLDFRVEFDVAGILQTPYQSGLDRKEPNPRKGIAPLRLICGKAVLTVTAS